MIVKTIVNKKSISKKYGPVREIFNPHFEEIHAMGDTMKEMRTAYYIDCKLSMVDEIRHYKDWLINDAYCTQL
jgi:hypothetical protein